jgi:hypothetical protein
LKLIGAGVFLEAGLAEATGAETRCIASASNIFDHGENEHRTQTSVERTAVNRCGDVIEKLGDQKATLLVVL